MPVLQLSEEESERLLRLEDELHARLVGQNEAVTAVAQAVLRALVKPSFVRRLQKLCLVARI